MGARDGMGRMEDERRSRRCRSRLRLSSLDLLCGLCRPFRRSQGWLIYFINSIRIFFDAESAIHYSQHRPSYLRFFRDSTIVDLVFSFMFTIVTAFCASRQSTRALLCEQLSRQPELLRSVANSGLNFENCELWFENAVVVFTCVMLVTLVMRVSRAPPFWPAPICNTSRLSARRPIISS